MEALHHVVGNRVLVAASASVAACIALYWHLQPIIASEPPLPDVGRRIMRTRTRDESAGNANVPYPLDAFHGGRHVKTAYGDMQVFEWGPEDGEKVLLVHGIGTPCVALGDMARELVSQGHRVMLFDLFGRGYSDTPTDVQFDERLYTSQILLALASSPHPWTGTSAFHIIGYSLGGAIAAAFATYHANLLKSATLVCPGGLVRMSHVSRKSRFLFSSGVLPETLLKRMVRSRLEPQNGAPSADVPTEDSDSVEFDDVLVAPGIRVGDVVKWQLHGNDGFVDAYMSTIRNAPIYGQHEKLWKKLSEELRMRRTGQADAEGLESGKICLILAERDPIVVANEWSEDAKQVLGEDAVDIHVVKGGHEIAISKGKEVANIAIQTWRANTGCS